MNRFVVGCALGLAACATSQRGASSPTTSRESGVILGLKVIDGGCNLYLVNDGGNENLPTDLELCQGGARDATALIEHEVIYTVVRSDGGALVTAIEPASAPR